MVMKTQTSLRRHTCGPRHGTTRSAADSTTHSSNHSTTRNITRCFATRFADIALLIGLAAALLWLVACTESPSWQTLLTAQISQQYPTYNVQPQPDGSILVQRPRLTDVPVDVKAIREFCRRGPKDCNYATDQMLLELGAVKK
jgi:hypothetical protein